MEFECKRLDYIEGLQEIIEHGKRHCYLHSMRTFSITVTPSYLGYIALFNKTYFQFFSFVWMGSGPN